MNNDWNDGTGNQGQPQYNNQGYNQGYGRPVPSQSPAKKVFAILGFIFSLASVFIIFMIIGTFTDNFFYGLAGAFYYPVIGFVLGILAIVFSAIGLGTAHVRGFAIAGLITSIIISIVWTILVIAALVIVGGIGAAAGSVSNWPY